MYQVAKSVKLAATVAAIDYKKMTRGHLIELGG